MPTSPPAAQQTFALEEFDGLTNRQPCDAELFGQFLQGWNRLAQRPLAALDLLAKVHDQLDIDRHRAAEHDRALCRALSLLS